MEAHFVNVLYAAQSVTMLHISFAVTVAATATHTSGLHKSSTW
jgi:hypothetical protein